MCLFPSSAGDFHAYQKLPVTSAQVQRQQAFPLSGLCTQCTRPSFCIWKALLSAHIRLLRQLCLRAVPGQELSKPPLWAWASFLLLSYCFLAWFNLVLITGGNLELNLHFPAKPTEAAHYFTCISCSHTSPMQASAGSCFSLFNGCSSWMEAHLYGKTTAGSCWLCHVNHLSSFWGVMKQGVWS